jgi:hypothetical protein
MQTPVQIDFQGMQGRPEPHGAIRVPAIIHADENLIWDRQVRCPD